MSQNLKKTAFSATAWSTLDSFGGQGMQFVIGIVLARLLSPADFGLLAMLVIFIALAQVFVDSGLSAALVQKRDVTAQDESTMFYVNIAVALVTYGLLWIAAPYVAQFYKQPSLTALLRVLSVRIVISSFGIIQTTLLRKRLDFRSLFLRGLLAIPLSGAVGIVMAYRGFGVWSLVAQQLVGAVVSVVCYWVIGHWRPRLVFSTESFRALTGFGSRQLVVGLLDTLFQNIYNVVIGKLFAPAALGFYSRAVSLQKLAVNNVNTVVSRVAFPLFCTVHHEVDQLRKVVSKTLAMLAMVTFPIMVGLMVVATPLVTVVLSAKWLSCVPYFRMLCIIGILYPLHVVNVNVLRARGEMGVYLKLEFLKKGLTVTAIVLTYRWGIMAMIWGQVVQSVVAYFLNAHFGGKSIGYSWQAQFREILPYIGATLFMAVAAVAVGLVGPASQIARLLLQAAVGAIVYVACCHLLHLREFKEVREWAKQCLLGCCIRAGIASARA
jgi:teichuronic acid exporter